MLPVFLEEQVENVFLLKSIIEMYENQSPELSAFCKNIEGLCLPLKKFEKVTAHERHI